MTWFVVGLAAPLVAALVVLAAPRAFAPGDAVRILAAASVPVWLVVLVTGGIEHAGRFSARPVAAAAACGVALLVSATPPVERGPVDVGVLVTMWAAVTFGVTAGVGDQSAIPLAVGTTVAVLAVAASRNRALPTVLVTAGAALVVGGVAAAGDAAVTFGAGAFAESPAGVVLAVAGVVAMLAGALDADGPVVLAVPALAVAAVVAPHAGTPFAVVVPLAIAAVVAAWFDRGALAVALTAIAALAVSTPAGLLLAAAAVVVIAVPSSPALLAGVPGAVVLATTATHDPSAATIAAAVSAGATAALLALGRDLRPARIPLGTVPAAVVGAHLTIAAGSWSWTGVSGDLAHWNRGAGAAAAVAILAVVGAAAAGVVPLPAGAAIADAPAPEPLAGDPPWARPALRAALALLGLAAVALVRSSLRSV